MSVSLSRREQNKAATRSAIESAVMGLLREKGPGNFTVDDLAARAGISRRTFFNYFPSAEAASCGPLEDFLDLVLEKFDERPEDEPLLDSVLEALTALADPMHFGPTAEIYALTDSDQGISRFQLQAWSNCERRLYEAAKARLDPRADELYLHSLVAALFGIGKAAMQNWSQRHGAANSPAALGDLKQTLITAVGYLRDGFAQLPTSR